MTDIRTVQVWGVLTKLVTAALGVVQTAIVLRLLGPEAYGIVGIVTSIGALVGVSQHVGAVDAAIREIAVADTTERRAAVFWVSMWFRLAVTVPISLALVLLAPWIGAHIYPLSDIPHLVRLMSIILIVHGIQGILGGAYTGQRAFGVLYALQLVTAVVNIPLFAGFVWLRGAEGFFEGVIVAGFGFSVLLALFLRRALGGSVQHPDRSLMRQVFRDIIHTGGWTYVARILSVAWQRIPVLLLGRWTSPDVVGLLTAAITFGSKLQLIAAALGEVNLSFLSHAFAKSQDAFRRLALRTLEDVGAVTLVGALFLALFADVLVSVLLGPEYLPAIPFIRGVTWAYAAFSFLDIATNTVFVPSGRSHLRAGGFLVLCFVSVGVMLALRDIPESAAVVGVLAGGIGGLLAAMLLAAARMQLSLFPPALVVPLLVAVGVTAAPSLELPVRALVFCVLAAWICAAAFPFLTRLVFAPRTP